MKLYALIVALVTSSSVTAQPLREVDFVRGVLEQYQSKSFTTRKEYCGYLAETAQGKLFLGPVRQGTNSQCSLKRPETGEVVATWHTHANARRHRTSDFVEIPSLQDLDSDVDLQTRGYVGTPGGRFWYVDPDERTVTQLCVPSCLPVDPFYRKTERSIQMSYTRLELIRFFAQP